MKSLSDEEALVFINSIVVKPAPVSYDVFGLEVWREALRRAGVAVETVGKVAEEKVLEREARAFEAGFKAHDLKHHSLEKALEHYQHGK